MDYDVVLSNLYRDGNDSAGLHADAEPGPVIASLSLGAERLYRLERMNGRLAFAERLPMADCWLLQESANEFLARGSTKTRCWQSHAPPDLPAPTLMQSSLDASSFLHRTTLKQMRHCHPPYPFQFFVDHGQKFFQDGFYICL